jgi:hypothetical protein
LLACTRWGLPRFSPEQASSLLGGAANTINLFWGLKGMCNNNWPVLLMENLIQGAKSLRLPFYDMMLYDAYQPALRQNWHLPTLHIIGKCKF